MAESLGSNPETNSGVSGDKPQKKRQTRRLPLASMLETTGADAEDSSEKSAKKRVDRVITELVVRRKLQESRRSKEKDKPETSEMSSGSDESEPAASETDSLNTAARETIDHELQAEWQAEADEDSHKEQQSNEDETYEELPELELQRNDFVGDVVVHLRDPIEGRVTVEAEDAEASQELAPEEGAAYMSDVGEVAEYTLSPTPSEDEAAPRLASGGGGTPPPRRPESFSGAAAEPPERPDISEFFAPPNQPNPRDVYYQYAAPASPNMPNTVSSPATAAEGGVTKQELNDAIYHATKVGQNRGVATGLLVGAGYEHFKHKKREKKAEKEHQAQTKQFKKTERANEIYAEEHERRENELRRRLQTVENRSNDAPTQFQKQELQAQPEKRPVTIPEQIQNEQLQVPPEHRLETSAWHSIEVDAKTGRPVENQTFVYGEEYNRERAQENAAAVQGAATAQQPATARATVQQYAGGGSSNSTSTLPPVDLPSASTQGPPPSAKQTAKTTPKPKTATGQTAGLIWPWLVALTAIVICLALILH